MRKIFLLILFITLSYIEVVCADIVLDGSLGSRGALQGPNFVIEANMGQQYGGNLFHSFEQFDIKLNESASFSGANSLSDFVIWAKQKFPAKHYVLILWSHGGGTSGFCDKYDLMTLRELQQAYTTIANHGKLDLVAYDTCFMGAIEVAEITKTVANFMLVSVEVIPSYGFDYKYFMNNLIQNPNLRACELIQTGYIQQIKDDNRKVTLSLTDLRQLDSFYKEFNKVAKTFKDLMQEKGYKEYQGLSYGLINSQGYPFAQTSNIQNLGICEPNSYDSDCQPLNTKAGVYLKI